MEWLNIGKASGINRITPQMIKSVAIQEGCTTVCSSYKDISLLYTPMKMYEMIGTVS